MSNIQERSLHYKADAGKRADELEQSILNRILKLETRVRLIHTTPEIPLDVLESFYILDKGGNKRRFSPWSHQLTIINMINEDMKNRVPVRIIHDKPRRVGSSTLFSLITYFLATRLNLNCVVIGHKDTSSQVLYAKIKYAYDNDTLSMRGNIKPNVKNKNMIEFSDGGSIQIVTAGSKDAVTGSTMQVILATEHALWPGNAGDQMRGLVNTVDNMTPLTFIFIESTGRPATDFQDRWNNATAGKSNYRDVFVPWFEIKEYTKPFSNKKAKKEFIKNITEDEKELLTEFPQITYEQLNWRRETIRDNCRGVTMASKLIDFRTEYPATPSDSFTSSDASTFDTTKLNVMMGNITDPEFVGELAIFEPTACTWEDIGYDIPARESMFTRFNRGRLKIWEWPEKGVQYCGGMDVAEGIEAKDYERDNSALVLRRSDTGKIILTWKGKLPPDDFANLCHCIGMIYNVAYLCPESNNMGILTAKTLWKIYPRYAIYMSKIGPDDHEVNRIGFNTSSTTKGKLLLQLSIAIKNDEFDCNDIDLLRELINAQMDSRGKTDTGGRDLLMAAALSEEARQDNVNWNVIANEKEKTIREEWEEQIRNEERLSKNLLFQDMTRPRF